MNKKGDSTPLFAFLISFWILLLILANVTSKQLMTSTLDDYIYKDDPDTTTYNTITMWISNMFEILDDIPIINSFTPLFKIMFIGYVSDEVPTTISILLSGITIFSMYVTYRAIRGY